MNAFTKSSLAGITLSAFLVNQIHAYMPPISFEAPDYPSGTMVGTVQGSGWILLEGTASVSPAGSGFGGGQALKLAVNPNQEALIKRTVEWNSAEKVAFIDLRVKPAADPEGSYASFFANGTQLAFQVPEGGQIGEIWVYNGSGNTTNAARWAKTVGTFDLTSNGLTASSYTRITLRHDYQRNIWDLFIGEKLAAANLVFEGRGANLEEIELYGSKIGDTHIDNLSALTTNMLFEDADKDGLPDTWETANGSNPNLYDRDNIKTGTGKSYLDHYMDSLWLGGLNGKTALPSQGSIPPLTLLGSHQAVSALKGSLSVGGDGAAAYSLPIDIPKGTAGMEPKISLNYSSGGGNGIAGVGWSIGGLQSITRGTATAAKDGFAGTVNFNEADRFYFNGERLVCVSGVYGELNSIYRTEIDSFARITLKGGDQNSPASWWQVETKAGLIIELGNSTDSKILAPAVNAPLVWDVSRVSDTLANYYTINWADTRTPDNLKLDNRRLSYIAYTGSSLHAPYCRINFVYEARPDTSFAYTPHGTRMENTLRLRSIATSTNNQTNHTYQLLYESSAQSSRSLLKSVFKQQADGSTTNPTLFSWDGLQANEPRWAKVDTGTLPSYGGALYDANTANINSAFSTSGTSARLEGDAARFHVVPGNINVTTGTFIEFDFRGALLDNGAYLVIDGNSSFNNSGEFCIRIKRYGAAAASLAPRRDLTYTAADGLWQTYRVGFQGNSNAALNLASGSFANLALINFDDNASNGVGYAEFKNIRVGSAAALDAGTVSAVSFPETFDIPRFTAANGASRGIRVVDLNSDSLPDLIDQKVQDWEWLGNELVPKPSTISGTLYRNTGSGFTMDSSLLPNPRHTLTNAGGSGDWITRFDLNGVPCDVNADGQADLFVTELKSGGSPGTTATQSYKFMTYSNGAWVELPTYSPAFESRGTYPWGSGYPGFKQLLSKELVDMNRDGYPDLVIETNGYASLASTIPGASPATLAPALTRTVFLNLVHKGSGWVQSNHLALPLPLQRTDNVSFYDMGNRLIDYDGDGFLDMLSATYAFPMNSTWSDQRISRKFFPLAPSQGVSSWISPANSSPAAQDRTSAWIPTGIYPTVSNMIIRRNYQPMLPTPVTASAPFCDAQGSVNAGTALLDLNGDGLVDIHRANSRFFSQGFEYPHLYYFGEICHSSWLNSGRETAEQSSRWQKDTSPYGCDGTGYNLPISLTQSDNNSEKRSVYADLNGDGLVDILFAPESTGYVGLPTPGISSDSDPFGGTNNGAFINTGNGWTQDTSWGLPTGIRLGKINSSQEATILADMNGDGFPDIIGKILNGQQPELWLNQASSEVITAVTDGFGSQLEVEYKHINDPAPTAGFGTRVYEAFSGTLPAGHTRIIDARLVVSRYAEPDGLNGKRWKSQRYGDLRYDRNNETSLGFGWIEALDESNGQCSRTEFRRDFPYAGSPSISWTTAKLTAADITNMPANAPGYPALTPGNKILTMETAEYAEMPSKAGIGGMIRRPVQISSVKHLFDLDGTLKGATTTTQLLEDFDTYGFVKKSTVTSLDEFSVETSNAYTHRTTNGRWHLGRLTSASVKKGYSALDEITKNSSFTYNTTNGLLTSETIEPGSPLAVTTAYTHDTFGNVEMTSVTARPDINFSATATRSAATIYDGYGRFVTAESNAAGHTVTYEYDVQKALLQSTTDISGLTTYFTYDQFGTLIQTHHPDGTKTAEITGYATNASVPTSVFVQLTNPIRYFRAKQSSGTPVAKVYLDALGRELVTETTILRNANSTSSSRYRKVYAVTKYDNLGRKTAVSEAFASSETPLFTTIQYDILSRTIKTIHPDGEWSGVINQGAGTFTSYLGAVQLATYSKVRNQSGQILERWEDEHGRLAQSKDPSGQITTFAYNVESRLKNAIINNNSLLTNIFDQVGNKTGVIEANSGYSQSSYNGFGELVRTVSARGDVTTYSYDSIGRPLVLKKPEGTYITTYSIAAGVTLGKPLSITGSLGVAGYLETFTYDSLGRPSATTKTQFGETFTTSTVYDALGRVASSTDAGGLTVFNEYDPTYSFPLKRKFAPGTYEGAGTVLWQAGTYDSKGRALTQSLALGVTTTAAYDLIRGDLTSLSSSWSGGSLQNKAYEWDELGNLESRTDHISGRLESFGHDHLNRLNLASVTSMAGAATSTVPPSQTFTYSTNGNLRTKGSSSLSYADSTRPHAVTSAKIKGSVTNRTYAYDTAGYVVSDGKRTYDWTSYGQLRQIDYLAAPDLRDFSGTLVHAASRVTSTFDFDSGGNRARQTMERIAANDSRKIEFTLYLGSYEREIHQTKANGTAPAVLAKTVHRHSLGGGVIYTRTAGGSDPGVKLMAVLADHLGSTDVIVTGKWNTSTAVFANITTERQSFDAWGERRAADTQVNHRATDSDAFRTSAQEHHRGYTGHEQLDDSGLIHMNGRIYDPELGRFLSPDPYIQIPEYSQNFNRYSNVLNNPLNATDPSGFSFLSKFFSKVGSWIKENWRTIVVIVVVAILTLTPGGQAFIGPIAGSLSAATGISATAATGAVVGSIAGGLNAALAGGDLGDILRGAVVGGIQGGISGGILHNMEGAAEMSGSLWDKAAHVAGHGIVGGASNVAMGGKFQDGFLSAAAGAYAGWTVMKNTMIAQTIGSTEYGRTVIAGVVGGTASVLGGGKFANGAYTAAFQHLFNHELEFVLQWTKERSMGVRALFDKKTGKFWIQSNVNGEKLSFDAKSGGEFDYSGNFTNDGSEIPSGEYWITSHAGTRHHGLDRWFSLFANDYKIDDISGISSPWNKMMTGRGLGVMGRGQFRMHIGTRSTGCITCFSGSATNSKNYNNVTSLIIGSGSYNILADRDSGKVVRVYGTLFIN